MLDNDLLVLRRPLQQAHQMSTDELSSIKEALNRIEKALVGDPEMGHTGIADRLKAVEMQARETDRKLLLWSGIFTGIWMFISIFVGWLKSKLSG
jgi:hypothetical protein